MPAALDVNWEAVKMLALQVGIREAARQMELTESAVMQRSAREGWLANLPRSAPLPASMVRTVSSVSTPSQLLIQSMAEDSQGCRSTALRVAHRALKRVERCDDDELMQPDVADVLNKHTKTASVAGGWNAGAQIGAKINLHLTGAKQAQTMDAEWSEVQETPSLDVNDY